LIVYSVGDKKVISMDTYLKKNGKDGQKNKRIKKENNSLILMENI